MPTLEVAPRSDEGPKDSSLISSETVKPMPASAARPTTSIHWMSGSRLNLRRRVSSQVVAVMPTVLPTSRPTITPSAATEVQDSTRPLQPSTNTPAEKKAKIGTHSAAENGRTRCSRWEARPTASELRSMVRRFGWTGTMKARTTPAMVAWMPEL